MGCVQSRVDNEEAVSRCKERRQMIKAAVVARNAFAAAHSAYAVALKNTGASLSEFAHGEAHDHRAASDPSSSSAAGAPSSSVSAPGVPPGPLVRPPIDTLLPPPPPLPEFSPSPLQRSISLPDLPKKNLSQLKATPDSSIREEDEDNVEEDEEEHEDGTETAADEEEEELEADPHRLDRLRPRNYGRGKNPTPISPAPTPPPPPRLQPSPSPPPMQDATWDYFFAMDENMAGHSLRHAEEIQPEREVIIEERLDRSQVQLPPPPPAVDHVVVGGNDEPVTPKRVVSEAPLAPRPPSKQKQGNVVHHQHTVSAPAMDARRVKIVAAAPQSVNLLQVLKEIDDHFLKAFESAHEVSKMLEATRMHYHSNFADTSGHIDHSSRVMQVITWNKSFKGIPNAHKDLDNDEGETHATVLDKMLAWEKKLYDEVKAGELMKIEYQRKVALLNRQKKRGVSPETLEKTKAAVSHLHTRYIVDMQSMDSTVLEIQRLRDKQLYPRLVDLVNGMAKMWKTMFDQHDNQLKIVSHFKSLDISNASIDTSEDNYKHTKELCDVVKVWHSQLQEIVDNQKEYIHALTSWLKLNLIPIESSLKEKVSSPPRPSHAPIQALLQTWNEHLDKLPDEFAKNAILSFSAVMNTIVSIQQEEMKQKEKCEETHREYIRRSRAFEDWHHKYSQRRAASSSEEAEHEGVEGAANEKDPVVAEKRFIVESLKSQLDAELENHKKLCKQVQRGPVSVADQSALINARRRAFSVLRPSPPVDRPLSVRSIVASEHLSFDLRTTMGASSSLPKETTLHEFTVKDGSGNDVDLEMYKGKVLLVVNVASKCGFTEVNYTQLTEIYNKYKDKDFEILAFPCNQFLRQEPGNSDEIKDFACTRFEAEFPIFQKVRVNGPNTAPVYRFLKASKPVLFGSRIKWNFTKFLVDKEGKVIERYATTVPPLAIEKDIQKALGVTPGEVAAGEVAAGEVAPEEI